MEKEPHWIGHRTAERRQTESGYQYRDPDNQSLAIMLGVPDFHAKGTLFDGADLWEVDRFDEGMEARNDPAAEKYRARLNLIRELHRNGNLKACLSHADVINAGMQTQAQLEREHRHREALEIACVLSAQRLLPDPPTQQGAAVPMRDTTTAPSAESADTGDTKLSEAAASLGATEAMPADGKLTKRERQIRAIEATADALGFPHLIIPTGGKQRIKSACKKNHANLFGVGDDPFIEAWQEAVRQSRIRMANHEKYAQSGK